MATWLEIVEAASFDEEFEDHTELQKVADSMEKAEKKYGHLEREVAELNERLAEARGELDAVSTRVTEDTIGDTLEAIGAERAWAGVFLRQLKKPLGEQPDVSDLREFLKTLNFTPTAPQEDVNE